MKLMFLKTLLMCIHSKHFSNEHVFNFMDSIKQVIGLYILLDFCLLLFMTTAGARCIGEWLMHNDSLKELYMSYNAIGDVGISQLMKGLHQNMSLTELNVMECGFSVEGTTCNSSNTGVGVVYLICTRSLLGLICTCQTKHNHMCYK